MEQGMTNLIHRTHHRVKVYNKNMEHVGYTIKGRQNIILRGADPITKGGFAQVPVVVLQDRRLSNASKLVYAMMLYYAWHKSYCFPGQERLGKDIGKDARTVRRAVSDLSKNGFLEVKRRGLTKTNIYYLYITPRHK
jgi:hypothetical protein